MIFPGLNEHPKHDLVKSQMKSPGSIITIELESKKENKFFNNLKLVKVSQSLGGFSTIIQVPRKMIEFSESDDELNKKGITNNLLRISVGLEDLEDLIDIFKQALKE